PGPEPERILGAHAKADPVDHAGAGASPSQARVLEEGEVSAWAAVLVRIEEVVNRRVVLVDGLLDQAQAHDTGVKAHVPRRVGGDGTDVMDSVQVVHLAYLLPRRTQFLFHPAVDGPGRPCRYSGDGLAEGGPGRRRAAAGSGGCGVLRVRAPEPGAGPGPRTGHAGLAADGYRPGRDPGFRRAYLAGDRSRGPCRQPAARPQRAGRSLGRRRPRPRPAGRGHPHAVGRLPARARRP